MFRSKQRMMDANLLRAIIYFLRALSVSSGIIDFKDGKGNPSPLKVAIIRWRFYSKTASITCYVVLKDGPRHHHMFKNTRSDEIIYCNMISLLTSKHKSIIQNI